MHNVAQKIGTHIFETNSFEKVVELFGKHLFDKCILYEQQLLITYITVVIHQTIIYMNAICKNCKEL